MLYIPLIQCCAPLKMMSWYRNFEESLRPIFVSPLACSKSSMTAEFVYGQRSNPIRLELVTPSVILMCKIGIVRRVRGELWAVYGIYTALEIVFHSARLLACLHSTARLSTCLPLFYKQRSDITQASQHELHAPSAVKCLAECRRGARESRP